MPDFNGPDGFTFMVNDGTVDSNAANISVTVNAINDPPVANPDFVVTDQDQLVDITLTASDVENDPLTFSVVPGGPMHGTLTGAPPDVTYTPDLQYNGPDGFEFIANDGQDDSQPALVDITVNPINQPPEVLDLVVQTNQDESVDIDLTATDPDGDPIASYVVQTNPIEGVLSGTPPNLTYTPGPGFYGQDSFTYTAEDLQGAISDPALVTIEINGRPVAVDDGVVCGINLFVGFSPLDNDFDPDGFLDGASILITEQPQFGTVAVGIGGVMYQPIPGYFGYDSFKYTVTDDQGAVSVPATVTVLVNTLEVTINEFSPAEHWVEIANRTAFPAAFSGWTIAGQVIVTNVVPSGQCAVIDLPGVDLSTGFIRLFTDMGQLADSVNMDAACYTGTGTFLSLATPGTTGDDCTDYKWKAISTKGQL
jgi:hypothetical protein